MAALALEAREVDAHQGRGREAVRGFFQCLARHAIQQTLARVQVARRVVQAQALCSVLFHQQVSAITLDHGGHGLWVFVAEHLFEEAAVGGHQRQSVAQIDDLRGIISRSEAQQQVEDVISALT